MGVLFEVSKAELALFDLRELNYDRQTVTTDTEWLRQKPINSSFIVYAYVPKPDSIQRRHNAIASGADAVVVQSYLAILERAAQQYEYDTKPAIPVPECSVRELRFQDSTV